MRASIPRSIARASAALIAAHLAETPDAAGRLRTVTGTSPLGLAGAGLNAIALLCSDVQIGAYDFEREGAVAV
jgi:hypothetical protein